MKRNGKNTGELAAVVAPLLDWYAANARVLPWRENREPYRIWLSEIMLQQTRVEAVKPYFERFLAAAPDIGALAALPEEELLKLWEGLGYYRRARLLQGAARRIVSEHGGIFPSPYDDIRALPGVGDYTAGAISSIAFGAPTPAVDGNVLRVIARYTGSRAAVDAAAEKKRITAALQKVYPAGRAGDFTQSLMELGATVCLPNGAPRCDVCPLAAGCRARRDGATGEIPVKKPKAARRIEARTVFLLRHGDRVALRRRPATGLLAGLWEFPHTAGGLSPEEAAAFLRARGINFEAFEPAGTGKHVFTHLEWRLTGYLVRCRAAAPEFTWASAAELRTRYPVPAAFRRFRSLLPE